MSERLKLMRPVVAVAALALVGTAATPAIANAGATTVVVSKASTGATANLHSIGKTSISKTGRYIAFSSLASNLVPGDTNRVADCFVRDQVGKNTERVSVSSGGDQANGYCSEPAISQDGRYVAFESVATNLGGATNGLPQIYLHDRVTGATTLVSERASRGEGGARASKAAAISGDGRLVVFESTAPDLVSNDTNGKSDIFVYDRMTGNLKRVSVRSNGKQANGGSFAPEISANGRFVVFDSMASNLIKSDTNKKRDVFIHDRKSGKTARVSVNSSGRQANGASQNPSVSGNGRFVAFDSSATSLVRADTNGSRDVFLRDRKKGKTIRISVAHDGKQVTRGGGWPRISNSGRYVVFKSYAHNLTRERDTNNTYDVHMRDHVAKKTTMISLAVGGKKAGAGTSYGHRISGDGRFVSFTSVAENLIKNDGNDASDIFRRGPLR